MRFIIDSNDLERRSAERTAELQEANEHLANEMAVREKTEHELIHMNRYG